MNLQKGILFLQDNASAHRFAEVHRLLTTDVMAAAEQHFNDQTSELFWKQKENLRQSVTSVLNMELDGHFMALNHSSLDQSDMVLRVQLS